MLDLKFVRDNLELVGESIKHRNQRMDLDEFVRLDTERRRHITEVESLKRDKNVASDEIAQMISQSQDATSQIHCMREVSQKIKLIEGKVGEIDIKLASFMANIPNIAHSSTPQGGAEANKIVREWGPEPTFDFTPQDHVVLGEGLGILDMPRGAKVAGSQFPLYWGLGAQMERALINCMLDMHTAEHGYHEV